MWKKRVITSNGILKCLRAGGQIKYRPIVKSKKRVWQVWACYPSEQFQHVISSVTGDPRSFKSADALFNFHNRMFPSAGGVFIPSNEEVIHTWNDDDRAAHEDTPDDMDD